MEWLRQSCRIMAKAPLAIFGVLGIYILLLFIANIPGEYLKIPYAGILISSIVTPFSALAFAGCGRELTQGRIPTAISCYAEGFKNPAVRNKLILLGLIYGLCVIVINFIVQALSAPAIEQWKAVNGVYDTAQYPLAPSVGRFNCRQLSLRYPSWRHLLFSDADRLARACRWLKPSSSVSLSASEFSVRL